MRRRWTVVISLAACACLSLAAVAWASETFTTTVYFTPDKLGAPTNLSASTAFATNGSLPTPISHVVAYGPVGLRVDVQGKGTCQRALLEAKGPSSCPADSRIGFGGANGLAEIAKEFIKEPYTLDLLLGPARAHLGHRPTRRPPDGLPFAATFTYADGTQSSASASIRCG